MIHALIEEAPHLFREVLMLADVEEKSGREMVDMIDMPAWAREMLP